MVVDVRVSERAGKLMRRDARSEPKKKDTIRLEMEVAPHRKMLKTVLPVYESLSDVGEIRVWFASKILTPCRMH